MRAQLRRRAAKKMKSATSAAENTVAVVKLCPRREKLPASGSRDIRHNLSAVSTTRTVHDKRIASVTSRGVLICEKRAPTFHMSGGQKPSFGQIGRAHV